MATSPNLPYPDPHEDCLFLNIWTPKGATNESALPVLFWIHGGALTTGTGAQGWCVGGPRAALVPTRGARA